MGRKRSGKTEAAWRARLSRFERSDLTVVEFCLREGVSCPSFYRWRKQLDQSDGPPTAGSMRDKSSAGTGSVETFVPVRVTAPALTEIELPSGVKVRVPANDAEALRTALQCCQEVPSC